MTDIEGGVALMKTVLWAVLGVLGIIASIYFVLLLCLSTGIMPV